MLSPPKKTSFHFCSSFSFTTFLGGFVLSLILSILFQLDVRNESLKSSVSLSACARIDLSPAKVDDTQMTKNPKKRKSDGRRRRAESIRRNAEEKKITRTVRLYSYYTWSMISSYVLFFPSEGGWKKFGQGERRRRSDLTRRIKDKCPSEKCVSI